MSVSGVPSCTVLFVISLVSIYGLTLLLYEMLLLLDST